MADNHTHAIFTALVPLPEGADDIPSEWFDSLPDTAIYAAGKITSDIEELRDSVKGAGWALGRKIKQDGWP